MAASASVVFVTSNRKDLLRVALKAAQRQSEQVRILVMDDASEDGTDVMMASEFPEVAYERSQVSLGPCYHRNRGAQLADTEIVFLLDDDSILQSPHTIAQTLADFDDDDIAVVAIPFKNILQSDEEHQRPSTAHDTWIGPSFVAASHAVRRSIFLKAGGYRQDYFYMVEEGDLAIRLLDRGKFVRLGRADPIFHHQPPGRFSYKADYYGRRNSIAFVLFNVPGLYAPVYLAGTTAKGLVHGFSRRSYTATLHGTFDGLRMMISRFGSRKPVRASTFTTFRRLKSATELAIDEVRRGIS